VDSRSPRADESETSTVAALAFGLWLIAASAFVAFVHFLSPALRRSLVTLEVELPGVAHFLVTLSRSLQDPLGLLLAAAVIGTSALPFVLGARRKGGTVLYGVLAGIAVFATVGGWFCVEQPLSVLAEKLIDESVVPPLAGPYVK
jgi:type II secretory pathway component PulF